MDGNLPSRRVDVTPLIYRDAWAFLRKAEQAADEHHEVKRVAYSRMALINASIAAEAFINSKLAVLTVDKAVDSQVEQELTALFGTPVANDAPAGYRDVRSQIDAVQSLRRVPALASRTTDLERVEHVLWRKALELGLEHCRTVSPNGSETRRRLAVLRDELEKREIKGGSVNEKWTRGLELLTLQQFPPDDPIVRRFKALVTVARGKRMHERPLEMVLNTEGQEEPRFLDEVSLENARIACVDVRSMIAGFYLAAGRDAPAWLSEINDDL